MSSRAIEEAVLAEWIHLEMDGAALGALDCLRLEIDRQGRVGTAIRVLQQLFKLFRADLDRENAVS